MSSNAGKFQPISTQFLGMRLRISQTGSKFIY